MLPILDPGTRPVKSVSFSLRRQAEDLQLVVVACHDR